MNRNPCLVGDNLTGLIYDLQPLLQFFEVFNHGENENSPTRGVAGWLESVADEFSYRLEGEESTFNVADYAEMIRRANKAAIAFTAMLPCYLDVSDDLGDDENPNELMVEKLSEERFQLERALERAKAAEEQVRKTLAQFTK